MESELQTLNEQQTLAEHDTLPETNQGAMLHVDHSHIQGWGVDRDPQNRPAVPMERTPPRLSGVHWKIPVQQPETVEVFHSIERPDLTPVFGTSVPPSGLSGRIRAAAFGWSENDLRHWLLLMLADRINVVEGLADDLAHGHIPNIFAEMGGKAEWQYNRAGLVRKAAIASAVIGTGYWLMRRKRRNRWDWE
jgi:hypothetical protein